MKPKISVIIPVYNVEDFLPKCLDCILNQTFNNIEVICINDGSTDNSLDILNNYACKNERIIVLSQENQGPGTARNKGLEIASGEYVAFVDPDDWVCENFLETLLDSAIVFNSDIVKGQRVDVYTNGDMKKEHMNFCNTKNNLIKSNIFSTCWWSCLYRLEIIKKYNIKFAPVYLAEDMAFLISFLTIAKTYSAAKNAEYYYTIKRPDSLTSKSKEFDRQMHAFLSKMFAFDFIQSADVDKSDYIKGMKFFLESAVNTVSSMVRNEHCDMLSSLESHIERVLRSMKYQNEFAENENYKCLKNRDFSRHFFLTRSITNKFKKLNFLKRVFYIGNCWDCKLITFLGLKFVVNKKLFMLKRF